MTRDEQKERALALKKGGLGPTMISEQLGVAKSTVIRWINPEYAARQNAASAAAKRKRTGVCKSCGGVTRYNGRAGNEAVSEICAACDAIRRYEERYWTKERIIEQIHRFVRENGRLPAAREWLKGKHGIGGDGYPYVNVVQREFGSWAEGIEQAGFPRPTSGYYFRDEEWRRKQSEARSLPLEVLIERLRQKSKDGIAPRTQESALYSTFWRRGISWADACEMAGVKPRGKVKK
jgi:hypothetical protein